MVHKIPKIFDIISYTLSHHSWKKVTALTREMHNFFTWSKLYDLPPKLDSSEKQLAIVLSRNLNFRQLVSTETELLKITVVCVDTPFRSFWYWPITMLCYHSAHVSTKSWCRWHGCCAYWHVVHIPESDYSMNSWENHIKNFPWQKNKLNLWLWELFVPNVTTYVNYIILVLQSFMSGAMSF